MKFGIIGYGRFGKLWAECLAPYGEVAVYDKKAARSSLEETLDCDYLFVLVPIGVFEKVCKQLKNKLPKKTVVVDACSVKAHPSDVMLKVLPAEQALIATHPLFGPDSVAQLGLKGRKIVLSNLRASSAQLDFLKKLFEKMGLQLFECTPAEHDLQMARSQALVHFIGRGLAALELEKQDLYTPDYEALLRINDVVNNDTWQLFFDMQRYNPHAAQVREKFLEKLEALNFEIESTSDLKAARQNIEKIDKKIIQLLGERFKQSKVIGKWKQKNGTAVLDPKREKQLKALHKKAAKKSKVPLPLVEKLFEEVMSVSRTNQNNL